MTKNLVNKIKHLYCFVFALFLFEKTTATHIVGGELIYDKIGINTFKITLKVFKDCDPSIVPGFDGTGGINPPCYIHIFDAVGNVINQIDMGVPVITKVAGSINNPCIITHPPCVEVGIYVITTTLSPITGGYYIVYQRCCRNAGILNIQTVEQATSAFPDVGASYFSFIPGPEMVSDNSSPRFTNFPPIDICDKLNFVFDHSATDPDGDSLSYAFSEPFKGLDNCCGYIVGTPYNVNCNSTPSTCPGIPDPPPYPIVTYLGPFNKDYPVPSNPSLTINSNTGLIQGKPNLQGLYAVGVRVEEWRNGILLSKHYRDFQFTVTNCTVSVAAAVADQSLNCIGQTITFTNTSVNQSANPSYFWNFGDPNTAGDTSLTQNPSYTYQDTGIYYITLIVNRGALCSDTLKKPVYIYPPLSINFAPTVVHCVKSSSVNFSAAGVFLPNHASYNWDFPSATPATSTLQNPTGIKFNSAGLFSVTLIAKQFACKDTFVDSIRILNRPEAKINNFPTQLCDPGTISFSNGSASEYPGSYSWLMLGSSNSSTYNEYEPTHVFSPAGNYTAILTMYRGAPCPDTSIAVFSSITINPLPVPGFVASPSITSIFDPLISLTSTTDASITSFYYDFGDTHTSNISNPLHEYDLPGKYIIKQTVTNTFNCVSSTEKEITILPEFRFWAPNAFTPDNNNTNEIFTPVTIGVSQYKFTVFDTWGHILFETSEPNVGWDGKVQGKTCKQDIYSWKARFFNEVTLNFETRVGRVTLLKASDEF